jgi:hypothetical protein
MYCLTHDRQPCDLLFAPQRLMGSSFQGPKTRRGFSIEMATGGMYFLVGWLMVVNTYISWLNHGSAMLNHYSCWVGG